jgi:hypothetical protein
MLYVAKSLVRPAASTVRGSIACSSVVNGPDSTTSVETVPVSAARTSAHTSSVSAKTVPDPAMRARRSL